MPIYEYQCKGCGEKFEVIQKFSDEPLATHETCGGAVRRLIGSPALQFKGSGWYVNDYAKSGKSETKPAAKDAPVANGGSESKPAGDSKPAAESKPAASTASESKSSGS